MMHEREKWFVATVIMACRVENYSGPFTCDEQIFLLQAATEDEAYQKAMELGEQSAISYLNRYGETVQWEFVGLENLEELFDQSLSDGVEIRSRLFDHSEPSSLVSSRERLSIFGAESNPHSIHYRQQGNPGTDESN